MKLSTKLLRIESGITSRLKLKLKYHNVTRIVEGHILGYSYDDNPALRVFELMRDNVRSDEFKIFLVSDITSISVLKEKFNRTVTKPTDEFMKTILFTTYGKKKKEE